MKLELLSVAFHRIEVDNTLDVAATLSLHLLDHMSSQECLAYMSTLGFSKSLLSQMHRLSSSEVEAFS